MAPSAEIWQWEELSLLPKDQRPLAARIFKASGPPEIFQIRNEKVKVQKKVTAKGGLFGTSHEEIQTFIENREIRQKVLVDPNPSEGVLG